MATINLLPWRAELKEELKQRFFLYLSCAVIFSLLFIFILHLIISNRLAIHLKHNAYLQNTIATDDQKNAEVIALEKQKQQFTVEINRIQQLSTERASVVHLFDDLVRIMPSGIYLTSIKRNQAKITLTGKADSHASVSELMRLIEKSFSFSKAMLTEIKSNEINENGNRNGNSIESAKEAISEFIVEIQMHA